MSSKWKVLYYDKENDFFKCRNIENGDTHRFDLFTDDTFIDLPDFGKMNNADFDKYCESLKGKTIEIKDHFPWVSFARGVKIINGEQ